jgi:hypothetical protein
MNTSFPARPGLRLAAGLFAWAMLAGAPLRLADQEWDPAAHSKPLTLAAQGSFFAGGELTEIEHSAFGGARPGTIWDGAMYVRYMIPAANRPRPSIVGPGRTWPP